MIDSDDMNRGMDKKMEKGGGGKCIFIGSLYEFEINVFIIEEKKL